MVSIKLPYSLIIKQVFG